MTAYGASRPFLFFPAKVPSPNDEQTLSVAARTAIACRSAGQELWRAFWPGMRAGYWGRSSVTVNHGALSTINACASGRRPGSSSSVASGEEFVSF